MNMWDERYSKKEYVYGKAPNDFLADSASLIPASGDVLCLAEGEGRNACFLAGEGFKVSAIDSSQEAIKKAKSLAQEKGVDFSYQQVSLEDFDYQENAWDGIVSIFAHTDTQTQNLIFEKVRSSLRPGGFFILEGYTVDQLNNGTGGPKSADMMFSLERLKEAFKGFDIIVARNIRREIHEGAFHNGISDVAQFICKKP